MKKLIEATLGLTALLLAVAAPAWGASGGFELTWGKGVNLTTGGNICTALSGNTCQAGTPGGLAGELNGPTAIAADAVGNIYVADQTNNRIVRFDASGTFERMWGKNVNATIPGNLCTAASGNTCQAGQVGALSGEMNDPDAVATDAAGNVFVADRDNHRIQRFDALGGFERTWGQGVNATVPGNLCTAVSLHTCQAGVSGGLGGQMSSPIGIAADSTGNIFVADFGNHRVQRFDSLGTFERTWGKGVNATVPGNLCTAASGNTCQGGSTGVFAGEMDSIRGVAADAAGNVYVADSLNHRIQRFDALGTFERTWGKAVNQTTGGNLCTAASGNICVSAGTGGLAGEMNFPFGVATDTTGDVYVSDQSANRIAKFDALGTFELTWGKGVNGTSGGNLCTAASGNTCQAGAAGGLGGEMAGPAGIAADPAGKVYAAEPGNHRIQRFGDPVPVSPPAPIAQTPPPPSAATGKRAAALKKCKKKKSKKARKKCKKKALKLPL